MQAKPRQDFIPSLNANLIESQNLSISAKHAFYSVGLNYARPIVCILVPPPPPSSQKRHLLFLVNPPSLKSENCLRPPFSVNAQYILVFRFSPFNWRQWRRSAKCSSSISSYLRKKFNFRACFRDIRNIIER